MARRQFDAVTEERPGGSHRFRRCLSESPFAYCRRKRRNAPTANSLIQLFCRITRDFFQCAGVYFWRRHTGDELVGEQADGKLAERFIGLRLLPQQSAVTADAVRSRRTTFVNHVQPAVVPALQEFGARSLHGRSFGGLR